MVWKTEIMQDIALATISQVQPPLDQFESQKIILDPTLLLEKQVDVAAKKPQTFISTLFSLEDASYLSYLD